MTDVESYMLAVWSLGLPP